MTETLLPCPFCNEVPELEGKFYFHPINECLLEGRCIDPAFAIPDWNRRHFPDEVSSLRSEAASLRSASKALVEAAKNTIGERMLGQIDFEMKSPGLDGIEKALAPFTNLLKEGEAGN